MEFILKGLGRLGLALLPAVYSSIFVYWRYQKYPWSPSSWSDPTEFGWGVKAFAVAAFIVVGILLYYVYTGLIHPHVIWPLKRSWGLLYPHRFHTRICDELGVQGDIKKKIGVSQACLFLTQADASVGYRSSTKSFNIGSHILYLSALMFLLFCLHELLSKALPIQHSFPWWAFLLFLSFMLILFGIGFAYDQLADFREVVFLANQRQIYKEIVWKLHKSDVFEECPQSAQLDQNKEIGHEKRPKVIIEEDVSKVKL